MVQRSKTKSSVDSMPPSLQPSKVSGGRGPGVKQQPGSYLLVLIETSPSRASLRARERLERNLLTQNGFDICEWLLPG
jgi:hypothetical protein